MVLSFAFCVQDFLEHGGERKESMWKKSLWCQGPVRGWRVWNRDPGLFKGVVLSSLEVLGAGTKTRGA